MAIVPEKTLPKAKNRPLSVVGTIFETYIISGPFGLQSLIDWATASSYGPSYKYDVLYFWAFLGDGRWQTIISRSVSAALIHFDMTALRRCFPSNFYSSYVNFNPRVSNILLATSMFPSMTALANLQMGSMMKATKALFNYFPDPLTDSFLQHFPSASK